MSESDDTGACATSEPRPATEIVVEIADVVSESESESVRDREYDPDCYDA